MRVALTLLLAAVVLCPLTAGATIINIPGDYPTIQEGIDSSSTGDTVLVQPDTYYENLDFNGHNVVLASLFLMTGDTAYVSSTIIDGNRSGSVIIFASGEDSTAQVVGFTIQNGRGGGIDCEHSSPRISNNTISGNSGSGISCSDNSSPTITNNIIKGNSAGGGGHGGGIYCYGSSPTISNNTISENWASSFGRGNGGGIACYESSPTISNNTITGNDAKDRGGGIYCENSNPTISYNIITGNSAARGGGIDCGGSGSPTISNNTISGNSAGSGGGIGCYNSDPTVINNIISGNSGGWRGGGIYCGWYSTPTISANTISGNSAANGGGIYCVQSSPEISNNTISVNLADSSGGGICCEEDSNPTIENNTVGGNWSSHGGGIYCGYSSLEISGNAISGNSATNGGGIYCSYSSPEISNNTISVNSADSSGGGICCEEDSNPTIENNTLSGNSSSHGGAICCENSSPTIRNNSISGNSVAHHGGGICCRYSSPEISNNSISGNAAGWQGGGIYCYDSSPTITNTILWADSAIGGRGEIFVYGGNPTVTYCDVQRGWPGEGNIDCDPQFVCGGPDKWHITWHSCCIDSGDPDSALDPDGTRADIGAYYYDQRAIITLTPSDTLLHRLDTLSYWVEIHNNTTESVLFDFEVNVELPNGNMYGPLFRAKNLHIPGGWTLEGPIEHIIPGIAPYGDYCLIASVSNNEELHNLACFVFTVQRSVLQAVSLTGASGWQTVRAELNLKDLSPLCSERSPEFPAVFALLPNYPNPFNASTIINYQLPVDSHVKLEVYNIVGRKVATLEGSKQQAGYRSVTWDASKVCSGLYFYKLTAGDYTETRRMMVVK